MVAKTKPTATNKPSLGALIDQMWAVREEKRKLEASVKELDDKLAELDASLQQRLAEDGLDKAAGAKASVSVTTSVIADVQDWDEFWKFILKHKFTHLLQRRVSDPAYRELLDAGKKVPGVQPFPKKRINLRTL